MLYEIDKRVLKNSIQYLFNANNLSNNTWGFSLIQPNSATNKLCSVPNQSNPLTIKQTTNQTNSQGEDTTIYYGSKVDLNQPSGAYKNSVVYTVVAEELLTEVLYNYGDKNEDITGS